MNCWFCNRELTLDEPICPDCGVENDFTEYQSIEPTKEEEMPVIVMKGMSPFFKVGMLDVGAVGTIKSIFVPSGQYENQTGEVDFDGKIIKISLNGTSVRDIALAYGINTDDWVGKQIVYSKEDVKKIDQKTGKVTAVYPDSNIFRAVK